MRPFLQEITSLNPESCICGRTHIRMNQVAGRSDDMLITRGANVIPSQIECVLMEIEAAAPKTIQRNQGKAVCVVDNRKI